MGCTPLIGLHAGLALVAATLLRLNRLWAVVGSRVSFFLVLPSIAFAEIETGHRLRTGVWAPLTVEDARVNAKGWFLDWWLGTVPVGSVLALSLGAVAYAMATRRDALRRRTPAPAPPPTSESPR
jgi:hypothetical protein